MKTNKNRRLLQIDQRAYYAATVGATNQATYRALKFNTLCCPIANISKKG